MPRLANGRQEQFCLNYVADKEHNGPRAAIEAGYSSRTAAQQACKLLKKVKIQERISELMSSAAIKAELSAADVLSEIRDLMMTDITDVAEIVTEDVCILDDFGLPVYNDKGQVATRRETKIRIKDTKDMSPAAIKALSEIGYKNGELYVKRYDKMKAIEMYGKHLKLFTDKVEVAVTEMPTIKISK